MNLMMTLLAACPFRDMQDRQPRTEEEGMEEEAERPLHLAHVQQRTQSQKLKQIGNFQQKTQFQTFYRESRERSLGMLTESAVQQYSQRRQSETFYTENAVLKRPLCLLCVNLKTLVCITHTEKSQKLKSLVSSCECLGHTDVSDSSTSPALPMLSQTSARSKRPSVSACWGSME